MDVKIKLLTLFYSDKFKPVVHMGTAAFTIQTLRLMLAVLEEIRWTQGKLLSLNHHKCSVVVDTEKDRVKSGTVSVLQCRYHKGVSFWNIFITKINNNPKTLSNRFILLFIL